LEIQCREGDARIVNLELALFGNSHVKADIPGVQQPDDNLAMIPGGATSKPTVDSVIERLVSSGGVSVDVKIQQCRPDNYYATNLPLTGQSKARL
jgi:hypothetical protein